MISFFIFYTQQADLEPILGAPQIYCLEPIYNPVEYQWWSFFPKKVNG